LINLFESYDDAAQTYKHQIYPFSFNSNNTYNHFHITNYDKLLYSITITAHCDLTSIEDQCNKKERAVYE